MFRFFKRRKDKPSLMFSIFQHLETAIDKRQRKYADWLQQKTKHFGKRKLSVLLGLFCLAFGAGSANVLIEAFQEKDNPMFIEKISVPAHVLDSSYSSHGSPVLTKNEYENIGRFNRYMDSLYKNQPAGFDSITSARPGLIDSLILVETFYQQQLKTK